MQPINKRVAFISVIFVLMDRFLCANALCNVQKIVRNKKSQISEKVQHTRLQVEENKGTYVEAAKISPIINERRSFLQEQMKSFLMTPIAMNGFFHIQSVSAEEVLTQKPFAPPQAILPISRLRLWMNRIYEISMDLSSSESKYQYLKQMNEILSDPPQLFNKGENKIVKGELLGQLTGSISSANKSQYQSNRQTLSVGNKVAAMLNQADVERQFGMLQYAEQKRANDNDMRAAFNYYTSQLSFGDKYILTTSQEERKRMIRNEELPTLTAVITSDLDLRDLYRNQFLTAIEDLQAEVAYQVKIGAKNDTNEQIDVSDTLELIQQAHTAMEKWFDLIDIKEVEQGMKMLGQ